MSLPDTIFILLAALVLFGPKKLPEIARQVGKILAELRRASNEFKFQMEEELRQSDEAERRKQSEAAAAATANPAPPATAAPTPIVSELTIHPPATGAPVANRISPRAAADLPSEHLPAENPQLENPPSEVEPSSEVEQEAAPHA